MQPPRCAASVTVDGWSWRYSSRQAWALEDVTLTIEAGQRVLLLGASGSGKSTLLQSLAGLLSSGEEGDASGRICIDGVDARLSHHRIGMVLQDPDSQVMLSRIGDDVAFGCENLGIPPAEIDQRVTDALAAVSLNLPREHPTQHLSGGQKQRLALAGVLAMKPDVLLLDEPTALLDPQGVREVRDAVAAISSSREQTLIIVEHRLDVWRDGVDRVIVLGSRGRVIADGCPDAVFARHAEQLRALGVWVPDSARPEQDSAQLRKENAGTVRCEASDLQIGWEVNEPVAALAHIALRSGTVTAIIGPNGVGKSTLALTLGGVIAPLAGHVRVAVDGDVPGDDPYGWSSRDLITRIGSVFQIPEHQFVTQTVRDELALALRFTQMSNPDRDARVFDIAQSFGLEPLLDANPFTLSGGEQRRLSVASALIGRPGVLILDEPTFGQDALTWQALVTQIRETRDAGCAVAIVTHDEKLITELADTVVHLEAHHTAVQQRTSDAAEGIGTPEPTTKPKRLHTISPLAKIAAASMISVGLIVTLDSVSAAIALVLEMALLAFSGLTTKRMVRIVTPLTVAALLAGFTTALYGRAAGETHLQFALIHVTDGSLALALATTLRVLAIALPAVILFATIDPTDLSDSLEQHTTLSARFVVGALVSLRLLDLVSDDWRMLTRARRARGLGDAPRAVRFVRQAFALTVLSLRRADKLSTAMQARGFGGDQSRTWSRRSHFGVAEWSLIAIALVITATALVASIATGNFDFLFGGA